MLFSEGHADHLHSVHVVLQHSVPSYLPVLVTYKS